MSNVSKKHFGGCKVSHPFDIVENLGKEKVDDQAFLHEKN